MFDNLSDRFAGTFRALTGRGVLTEENIKDAVKEVRMALLEADVALPVVTDFIEKVKQEAVGKGVHKSLTPDKAFIKIVHSALVEMMGETNVELSLAVQPPAVILMAGLQGAGKTTTSGKLAKWILNKKKKKQIMLVSVDVYRPAAMKQLETLAEQVGVKYFDPQDEKEPLKIAAAAVHEAKRKYIDVIILDTAGRLHVDEEMMSEITALHQQVKPVETFFVIDSMMGQDAVNTAKAFNDALPLTGVILTKADGDARGGAALSVKQVTGKPIKFMGVGEKTDALEPFHPERLSSRILGMGDVLTLVEDIERNIDHDKAKKLEKKFKKGQPFNFNDMLEQFRQMGKLGGMAKMLEKLPGMGQVAKMAQGNESQTMLKRTEAIILSMTKQERAEPELINTSRKMRIAQGSGTDIGQVNQLMKQFKQMQKMMKKMSKKGNMQSMMKQMQGMMGGGMPPMGK